MNIVVTPNMIFVVLSKILVKEAVLVVLQLLHLRVDVALGVLMITVDVMTQLYTTKI
jgi:hypothetical protein